MATYKPLGRYSFELADTEYNKITKKIDGHISKHRKNSLHEAGEKMLRASKKFQIEIR